MDHEAQQWRGWLDQHGPALLLFARQWSATASDAQDALQTGFLRFWKTRARACARARDEVAYLYACVRSAAIDMGRTQRRQRARDDRSGRERGRLREEACFEPVTPLERSQRQARIESALAGLPADQREVVVMKIWGELTFAQIGAALSIPLHTAASRYRVALVRLAQDLAEEVAHDG